MIYTFYDRMMVGGVQPVDTSISLPNYPNLKAGYFLERREMGIINIGGPGTVMVDGIDYKLNRLDCLYIGKGSQKVSFESDDKTNPSKFYINSCPAHHSYPVQICTSAQASPMTVGSLETSNHRDIYKYIHLDGIKSCQLVMGITMLKTGSVWNTMPSHIHDRRMEIYLYFDLKSDQRVIHLMGEPHETRHLIVSNEQAIIIPSWSVHSGGGTSHYSFVWAMCGENLDYTDMDKLSMDDLK